MDVKDKVAAAIATLKPACDRDEINKLMAEGFEALLATNGLATTASSPGGLYISAMRTGFYEACQSGLLPHQREIAVLAILTVQGAEGNLALHVFIALASGLSPAEVLNVILLAGMYSGANLLSQAMRVTTKTFAGIVKAADCKAQKAAEVFQHVLGEFADPGLDAARAFLKKP